MAGNASAAGVWEASTQYDATAGATAAVALPPMYTTENAETRKLMAALISLNLDVRKQYGLNLFVNDLTHMVMRLPTESGVLVIRALDGLKKRAPPTPGAHWGNHVEDLRRKCVTMVQIQWVLVCLQLGSLCECFSGDFESKALALWLRDLVERREFETVAQWYAESYTRYAAWMQRQAKDNNAAMRVARSWRLKQIPPELGQATICNCKSILSRPRLLLLILPKSHLS